jgi:hypothetical protein
MFYSSSTEPPDGAGNTLSARDTAIAVVCVTLSVLIALPAMARLAEESKADACKAKLASLGKGLMAYRSSSSSRWPVVSTAPIGGPPGITASDAEELNEVLRRRNANAPEISASGYSWLTAMLPFVDEGEVFNELSRASRSFSRDPFDIAIRNKAGEHLSMSPIEPFQCPAFRSEPGIPYTSGAPEYRDFVKIIEARAVGRGGVALTNYVAVTATHLDLAINPKPAAESEKPNGVIVYSESRKGISTIPDGESNTIVVAETREPNYASWFDGTTAWVVAHDPNSKPPFPSKETKGRWTCKEEQGCRHSLNVGPQAGEAGKRGATKTYYRKKWQGKEPWQFGPSSMHEGNVVNHLFADTHVTSIVSSGPKGISANVYLAFVSRNGQELDRYAE